MNIRLWNCIINPWIEKEKKKRTSQTKIKIKGVYKNKNKRDKTPSLLFSWQNPKTFVKEEGAAFLVLAPQHRHCILCFSVMLEIKTAKTRKGKRELEKRAPKLVSICFISRENDRKKGKKKTMWKKIIFFISLVMGFVFFVGRIGEEDAVASWDKDKRSVKRSVGADLSPEEGKCSEV